MQMADLLRETDARAHLIALHAKLPARWREDDGRVGNRNPRFADWLAKQSDDQLPETQTALETLLARLQANPKAKLRATSAPRRASAQLATLKIMLERAGRNFIRWLRGFYDAPGELARCRANPDCLLESLRDYLHDSLSIRVRDDGLIEFWQLIDDTKRLIGDLPVVLFHFTSSRRLRSIRAHGLQGDRDPVNGRRNAGVYLTTEQSGRVIDGYLSNARRVHGGNGVMLTVKCVLAELQPDPDDADIQSGRTQFVIDHVPPERILRADRAR